MTKVICVNNNKGGVLKTTTTANLAGVAATEGNRVLIVDMDMQANVGYSFGISTDAVKTSIFDVLYYGDPITDAILNVHENIDIVPANKDMASFEYAIVKDMIEATTKKEKGLDYDKRVTRPYNILDEALKPIKDNYDVILIDTPPSMSITVGNALTAADGVIVPYTPEYYSMVALNNILELYQMFKENYNPKLEMYGILRTMVKTNLAIHNDVNMDTVKFCIDNKLRLFEAFIPNTIQFTNAIAYYNRPATLMLNERVKRNFDKAKNYVDLWDELKPVLGLVGGEVHV